MTVVVTRMPGGVSQVFRPDSGRITYKSRRGPAYLRIPGIAGVAWFAKKGSRVVIEGVDISLEDVTLIAPDSEGYSEALRLAVEAEEAFGKESRSSQCD